MAIRDSLDHARAHPDEAFETMRRHAVELDPSVIWAHVELYVNEFSVDLGEAGRRVASRLGDAGLLASDLLEEIPVIQKLLREGRVER